MEFLKLKEHTTYKNINVEGIAIRRMNEHDLEGAMRLSLAEGWNQTENDWRLFIENPANICLLAECDNKIVATTTAINYASEEAWIGMVLVDKEYRGLGLSKSLLSLIFEKLASFKSIKLDATALGQPVYQKFGFKDELLISRMVNLSVNKATTENSGFDVEQLQDGDLEELISMDEGVFGANRKQLIEFLHKQNPYRGSILRRNGKIVAFALGRSGSKYYHVGPVVAPSSVEAGLLISKSIEHLAQQPVVVDVLCDKTQLVQWLNSIGFVRQRDFVRMYRGQNKLPGKIDNLFLICGPEFG